MYKFKSRQSIAIFYAILAAALYATSSPISKLLLKDLPPMMMASFLYIGAGSGMCILGLFRRKFQKNNSEAKLGRKDLPYTIAMVLLDIAAPISLMYGLTRTTAANVSLLNNFEIVSTAVIVLFLFHETISKRLWIAIVLVTISSILLSVDDISSLTFSFGSIFVLIACVCWGLENNCTRRISGKDPLEIVVIKGFGSGLGALVIALSVGERLHDFSCIPAVLLLGFVAYGLSIFYYTYAQRVIGAAKTSTYYAVAPFIGVALSFVILGERPDLQFVVALLIMIAGTYMATTDNKSTDTDKQSSSSASVQ